MQMLIQFLCEVQRQAYHLNITLYVKISNVVCDFFLAALK